MLFLLQYLLFPQWVVLGIEPAKVDIPIKLEDVFKDCHIIHIMCQSKNTLKSKLGNMFKTTSEY